VSFTCLIVVIHLSFFSFFIRSLSVSFYIVRLLYGYLKMSGFFFKRAYIDEKKNIYYPIRLSTYLRSLIIYYAPQEMSAASFAKWVKRSLPVRMVGG